MRYLFYTNYQSGHSGLSNAIMSIEVGAVLAFLTNRFLLLDGNVPPPANRVSYGDRVRNDPPSRVTDLIDIPVAWSEPDGVETVSLAGRELSDRHLGAAAFYVPGTVDIDSGDARSFANGRTKWLHASDGLADVPMLRVTEDNEPRRGRELRYNLTFYSYFFYLDDETRRSVYQMLGRMRAKAPFAALAKRVAADFGSFNAVHMRRGDFKVTYGTTTLDRQPWEAIEVMDYHFRRQDPLVIVTDERNDPFFDEIKAAYPHHVFIDHYILDEYASDFRALPRTDSIALAYLSQLIAADSADFIGTMTSTFTALIQRYRGNRGKRESFKFLWNELPDPGERVERGRHPVSECIPLDRGMMIEEASGPYTWNRYNRRIAANWMREWPESFLTEGVLATGRLLRPASSPIQLVRSESKQVAVVFDGLTVVLHTKVPNLAARLGEAFGVRPGADTGNVIGNLVIDEHDGTYQIFHHDAEVARAQTYEQLARAVKLQIVPILVLARRRHVWLEGCAFRRAGHALVLIGDLGEGSDHLPGALCATGWELLCDDVVPIRVADTTVTPFGRSTWPQGASTRVERAPCPLSALIVVRRRLHQRTSLAALSPSVGVARLIGGSLDFRSDRERAIERLCKLVEQQPVGELSFSNAGYAAEILTQPFLDAERRAGKLA